MPAEEKMPTNETNCGKESYRSRRAGGGNLYYGQALCSKQCKNEWVSKVYRQKHGLPQITRRIRRKYAMLRIPAQNGNPTYEILEHRYVMEQKIGRKLFPEETVHHINGDRFNNDISNLELFSSRHGPGQRVIDKVRFAIEMIRLYPEFAKAEGATLLFDHVTDPETLSTTSSPGS
jgi:HNH endonuclease